MNTTRNLAFSNLKNDRVRSTLITLSIFLSTLFLMAIATFGIGVTRSSMENAVNWYGEYYGTYSSVFEDSIIQMERRSEFSKIGLQGMLGWTETEKRLGLYYFDDNAIDMTGYFRDLNEGSFPIKIDEIMGSKTFFRLLGYDDISLGQKVTISYRTDFDSPFEPADFIVSGFLAEREDGSLDAIGFISIECFKKKIPLEKRQYRVYVNLDDSLNVNSGNAETIMKELAITCGIDEKKTSVNFMYLWWVVSPDPVILFGCIIAVILVVIFSVIVIYNIFQVGIIRKIKEYGKIKAIGATKSQMRKIVLWEGLFLSLIGIPLGLIGGYSVMSLLFSIVFSKMLPEAEKVSYFSLPIMALVALAALSAVVLSLRKPMKIVSGISPVMAMKYWENAKKGGFRKGVQELSIIKIVMANLRNQRKRLIASIIMMGLSGVVFVVLANLIGNMDTEYDARYFVPYGEFQISLNYHLNDSAYPEKNLENILVDNPLDEDFITKIMDIEGVTELKTQNILTADLVSENNMIMGKNGLVILNREMFERARERSSFQGEFTYDEVSARNGLILGMGAYMPYTDLEIGKQESFKLFDGNEEFEWNPVLMGTFGSANALFVMTEDSYINLGLNKSSAQTIGTIWVDCLEKDKARVEKALNEMVQGMEDIKLYTYQEALTSSENSVEMLLIFGYALCLLIGVISFLNVANTIITSVITRKQEFGILQAIGMTNFQLNLSLQLEGLIFTIGTVLVANVIGIPLGYYLFLRGKSIAMIGLYKYSLPLVEIAMMIAVLTLLQLVLSFALSRNVKKESLVERIRYQG